MKKDFGLTASTIVLNYVYSTAHISPSVQLLKELGVGTAGEICCEAQKLRGGTGLKVFELTPSSITPETLPEKMHTVQLIVRGAGQGCILKQYMEFGPQANCFLIFKLDFYLFIFTDILWLFVSKKYLDLCVQFSIKETKKIKWAPQAWKLWAFKPHVKRWLTKWKSAFLIWSFSIQVFLNMFVFLKEITSVNILLISDILETTCWFTNSSHYAYKSIIFLATLPFSFFSLA